MAEHTEKKGFYERMLLIDRRWIFLLLAMVVVLVYLLDLKVPVYITTEVRNIYDRIEELGDGDVILLAMDYDPSTLAELHPMTYTVLRQCFANKVKVLVTSLHQNGPGMADQAIRETIDIHYRETGDSVQYGRDLVFLGYKPYPALVINSLGQDFHISFPLDYYNTSIDSLPLTQRVHNLTEVDAIINISGTSATDFWISYGAAAYNVPLAIGVTGVMATDYYPYLQAGRIFGLMGGLKGAAEYERLADNPGSALQGMAMQMWAHLLIIFFIIIGNIGYFATRNKGGKGGLSS
jgi:hypothetical protein